ncbi:hypothetical protein ACMA1D_06160 [Streptomyces sp. 796.1]|uniref:hypothetical protein n=1 Tax=Streptomyces sp. 796.1 TaxID=3163029 RepID=UPI0039C8CE45
MDDYDRKAARAKWRLFLVGVLSGTLLVGGGVIALTAVNSGDDSGPEKADKPRPSASATARPSGSPKSTPVCTTPANCPPVRVLKPRKVEDGASLGFPDTVQGALSAAVARWEEYAFLDDQMARRQLTVTTSRNSPETIDKWVSEVRKLREGAGLPPSGAMPAGFNVTTVVKAIHGRSLTDDGEVVHLWMVYDRYAELPNDVVDDDPLKDEEVDVILKWEDGDWKLTEEEKYVSKRSFPNAYFPDSPYAAQSGWRQVVK